MRRTVFLAAVACAIALGVPAFADAGAGVSPRGSDGDRSGERVVCAERSFANDPPRSAWRPGGPGARLVARTPQRPPRPELPTGVAAAESPVLEAWSRSSTGPLRLSLPPLRATCRLNL